MLSILETERTYLREFAPEDAIHLFQMNSDLEVLTFTGDVPFKNIAEAQSFINRYEAYKKTGFGRYAVIRKSDDEFLGWCGLKLHRERSVVDVGYRFYKCYWNQGYATESTKAVITYAFEHLKLPTLVAHVHKDNLSSQRVLDKCNLIKDSNIKYDDQPSLLYKLHNKHYQLRDIAAKETWPVRHPVLRAGRPLEDVYMEADEKESTFHLGVFYKEHIVGVASFMEDDHLLFKGLQSRLRGMAVLEEFRKRGIAALLLKRGEELLKEKNRNILWFNARIVALQFYENLGYKVIGEKFDIPKVGPHYRMKKELK